MSSTKRNKLMNLFTTDSDYKKIIEEAENWSKELVTSTPDDKIAEVCAKYIKKVICLVKAFESVLTGNYEEIEEGEEDLRPKKGDAFNLSSIEFMQTNLFSIHYRISLINRETHKIINPSINFSDTETPLEEVVNMICDDGQDEIFTKGYVPKYVYDLELNTDLKIK